MMKAILTILFFAGTAQAGVPFWLPPQASTHTAYGTGYLSGVLKVYPSTSTAAASPAITLNGVTGAVAATSYTGSGSSLTGIIQSSATGTYALSTTGNAATASALAADPSDCSLPNVALGIGANGAAVCSQPSNVTGTAANITGNLAASQVAAGSLGSGVIASSVAIAGFYSANYVRANLGLAIGSDVQAYDADLADLADGSLTASKVGTGYLSSGLSGTIPTGLVDLSTVTTALGGKEAADATLIKEAELTANDFNVAAGVVSLDYTNGQAASGSNKGFLSSSDWTTFNNKQAAGNYITALTGNVTASGPGSAAATIVSVPSAAVDLSTVTTALAGKQAADADLDDLADGSLTGSKVGDGVPAANIAAGTIPSDVMASSVALAGFYSANAVRTNLGLAIGSNVQAYDADLDDLADGSLTGSKVGSGVPAANIASGSLGASVMASSVALAGFYSAPEVRSRLGLAIGSNVQAYDADLDDLADGTLSASKVENGTYFIGSAGSNGQVWKSDGSGAGAWGTDNDTTYTADNDSLQLSGTTFSAKSSSVTLQGNTFNGASQLVRLDGSGKLPTLDGSALTNLPSASGGAVLASTQTFTGANTFEGSVTVSSLTVTSTATLKAGYRISCPSGFTSVEAASRQLFCIQTAEEGAATYINAALNCWDKYGGRLPWYWELQMAFTRYSLTDEDDNYERISDVDGASGGLALLRSHTTGFPVTGNFGDSYDYRCVIDK